VTDKELIIRNRHENNNEGVGLSRYTIKTKDKYLTMICMSGSTLKQAERKAKGIFCDNFISIK